MLALVVAHRRSGRAGAARRLELADELPVHRVHAEREATRLDDFDLEVAALVLQDDHVRPQRDLTTADARAVRTGREGVGGRRVEALLHPVPRRLHLLPCDPERLRDVPELVLAELTQMV